MEHLFGFGHAIESDVPIPGALSAGDGCASQATPLSVTLKSERGHSNVPLYQRAADSVLFTPRSLGQYRCRADEIEIVPQPGCDFIALSELLVSTALPAVQWLRGHIMLHAAGVVLPGRSGAIAISGISGSGKSTLAAELLARGASLLADDSMRIIREAGGWQAAGLSGGLFQEGGQTIRRRFDPVTADRSMRTSKLEAIFVLGERVASPTLRRLDGPDAVRQLLAMQHRPAIPALLGLRGEVLQRIAEMARSLPVFLWQRCTEEMVLGEAEWELLLGCLSNGR